MEGWLETEAARDRVAASPADHPAAEHLAGGERGPFGHRGHSPVGREPPAPDAPTHRTRPQASPHHPRPQALLPAPPRRSSGGASDTGFPSDLVLAFGLAAARTLLPASGAAE